MVHVPKEAMSTGGDWLKPDFVEEREVTSIVITGEGEVQQNTWDGETKTRIVVPIRYEGQRNSGDPTMWSINPKSAKILSELFGEDSAQWTGKTVEITVAGEDKMRHILVDKTRTKTANPNAGKQEELP